MKIKEITMLNFRLYEYAQFRFSDKVNIIVGNNGQGKTTVLEAIALFALGKSMRAKYDKEMIKFEQINAQLRLNLSNGDRKENLAIIVTEKGKQISVNKIKKGSLSDLIGKFQMVMFTPDDLTIIKNGPDVRRKFLNQYMAQLSSDYIDELKQYKHLLLQRNLLLKQRLNNAISIWDESLSKIGAKIVYRRQQFIQQIQNLIQNRYFEISASQEILSIHYKASIQGLTIDDLANHLSDDLAKNLIKDKEKGYTSVGPHRDDLEISINNISASRFASQGQIRTAVLAMKIALIDHFYNINHNYPVLLLDDVLSELDIYRRQALISLIMKTQTIMTVATQQDHGEMMNTAERVLEVSHGIIKNIK